MEIVNYKKSMKVLIFNICCNLFLSLFKLIVGIIGLSSAMISDSIHSLADSFSTIIVIIGIKLSAKKVDNIHQYGHERFESISALILSIFLFLTGLYIGFNGFTKIIVGMNTEFKIPNFIALIGALISILIKEIMYEYTKKVAKEVNSSSLMADAWHHRIDALSSIASFIGIIGAKLGLPILDPIVSILICIFIIKTAITIFKDSIYKLVDKSIDINTINMIKDLVLTVDDVISIDTIKTRMSGNKIYIDLEIGANKDYTLEKSHEIAHKVHDEIEEKFKNVKHCMVHVNPK